MFEWLVRLFRADQAELIPDSLRHRSSDAIIGEIIQKSRLDIESAYAGGMYSIATNAVDEFLNSEDPFSEIIYVPGGSGIVRVQICWSKTEPDYLRVIHVDSVPEGADKEFLVQGMYPKANYR